MTRSTRFHLDEPSGNTARYLTKEQFGRRIYNLMLSRGWNQSELGRKADLPRDSISTYIRGLSMPTPKSLQKLADAFDMEPAELLPNAAGIAIDYDQDPAIDMKVSDADPSIAWLRVNRRVSIATATRIVSLLAEDSIVKADNDEAADAS